MLSIPRGTIRATVLIETITAAFEMEEIIYELRQHSSGLNCGRWDYIFSFIKKFRNHPDKVLPNRCAAVGLAGKRLKCTLMRRCCCVLVGAACYMHCCACSLAWQRLLHLVDICCLITRRVDLTMTSPLHGRIRLLPAACKWHLLCLCALLCVATAMMSA